MANGRLPQQQIEQIEPSAVRQMVQSLRQMYEWGRPKTDQEVSERIDQYFRFCEESSLRPGIEGLTMALHISRQTLFRWCKGEDCSEYRQELARTAKGFIGAYIEAALLSGKISPPSGIFLAKNWLGYKDTISLEESIPDEPNRNKTLDAKAIAAKYGIQNIGDIETVDFTTESAEVAQDGISEN